MQLIGLKIIAAWALLQYSAALSVGSRALSHCRSEQRTLLSTTVLGIRGGAASEGEGAEEDELDEEVEDEEEEEAAAEVELKTAVSAKAKGKKAVIPGSATSFSVSGLIKAMMRLLRPLFSPSSSSTKTATKSRSSSSSSSSSSKPKASPSMTAEHLEKSFRSGDPTARVQKELRAFLANPPDNCKLAVGANIRQWVVTMVGAEGTIYAGESYKLKLVFPKDYPSKPPSVFFLKPTPKHQHVYSNGDICLNLLGRDWRPTLTAQALVVSILSMLSSAKEKKLPQDNSMHADSAPGQQQEGWMYHDEKC